MRRFSAEYLQTTREGMWEGETAREALDPLGLAGRERVLDVGAGTGALTRVLREECPGDVIAVDADGALLGRAGRPAVRADALSLPVRSGAVDLAVCQALLVNLPDPVAALREFARVSRGAVAAIEPDNSAVRIDSTVGGESRLARRARERYLAGIGTDATLGAAREAFERAGLEAVTVRRYDHDRTIEPPYGERALAAARRKASGAGLDADRATILAGDTTPEEFDSLRQEWRAMGRRVIRQMRAGVYRHSEVVPFYVTVGEVRSVGRPSGR